MICVDLQTIYLCVCVCLCVCAYQGKIRDKVGYFPANFVQRVRPSERVWKVTAGFQGNRDKSQMTVKENQVITVKCTLFLISVYTHTETFFNYMQIIAEIVQS